MDTLLLQQVIFDQQLMIKNRDRGIVRNVDFKKHRQSKQISVITGIRRSGKSTLMLQLADYFEKFHFITFDDERLINFEVSDFNQLMIGLNKDAPSKIMVIDEAQNVTGWERFVRRLHDEGYKIFLSGSNSRLLSSELSTHLTGRYIRTELFPFSFFEFLNYKQIDANIKTSSNLAGILAAFDKFNEEGGFPEYIINADKEYLKLIYEDIIYRDLIVRFGIKNIKGFKNLAQYIFTNLAKETNYNALAKLLGFSSVTSVRDYISFLSESYMIFEVYKYDPSLKKQYVANKKLYVIDNGLRNTVSFRISSDKGRLFENMIFVELRRRGHEVWFYKTKNNLEVDFLIFSNNPELIQVCYDLSDPMTYKRETDALETAMAELSIKHSIIISYNESNKIETRAGLIKVVPAWQWLLNYKDSFK